MMMMNTTAIQQLTDNASEQKIHSECKLK